MTATSVRRAAGTARTMGRVIVADPIRQGRLRLEGLPGLVRELAILGVVALGSLLGSLILTDLWRRGPLTLVQDFEATPFLSAKTIVSFTLVTLVVAWVLVLAGGSLARPPVAALAAVAFLLFNSEIAEPIVRGDSQTLRLLADVVGVAYFVAPAVAVTLSLLRLASRRRPLRAVLAVAMVAATVAFFAANLAIYVLDERAGRGGTLPRLLDGAMNDLQGFLVPLFILAVAALVQLSHQVAEGVSTPFWRLDARVARIAVLVLIAVKLRYGLLGRVDEWATYVVERRVQAVQALAYVLLIAGGAWLFARLRDDDGHEVPTETVVYVSSMLLSSAIVILGLVTTGAFFLTKVGVESAPRWVLDNFPRTGVAKYLILSTFAVLLVIGLVLYARPRRAPWNRRLGGLLILLGAWIVPSVALQQLSTRDVGFHVGLVDLGLTLLALVYVVVRWRRLDTAAAVRLGALLVFASLVAGNGYLATRVVSRVLAFFAPPAVLLIVVGVLYVVLADSAFASVSSRNFPRETRVLLWLGYLIFVVAVTNYVLVAREAEYRIEFDRYAFHLLALPLAAWLAVRARIAPPEHEEED
ncbi:MAG: hypothetical protein M3326_10885 [Actinomycetota bacterium]|nr:hypothetical protein [Actinomycetota bacterium]